MKTVVLDGYTLNPGDLSWDALSRHRDVKVIVGGAPVTQNFANQIGAKENVKNSVLVDYEA